MAAPTGSAGGPPISCAIPGTRVGKDDKSKDVQVCHSNLTIAARR